MVSLQCCCDEYGSVHPQRVLLQTEGAHSQDRLQTFAKANLQRFQRWVRLNQNWCIWTRQGQENIRRNIVICDRRCISSVLVRSQRATLCKFSLHCQIWPHSPIMHFPPLLPVTNSILSLSWSFAAPSLQVAEVTDPNSSATCTGCNHYWHSTSTIFNSISYYYSLLLFCPAMLLLLLLCLFSSVLAHPDPQLLFSGSGK